MRSLTLKLTLAFLLVSLTGIALVAFFAVQVTASEFDNFVVAQDRETVVAALADYYQTHGSWNGVESALFHGRALPLNRFGRGFALTDHEGQVIVGGPGVPRGRRLPALPGAETTPIEVDGQVVGLFYAGTFGPTPQQREQQFLDTQFLFRVNRALLLGALGATALALLLGGLLARTLIRPLRELTTATRAVARGDLSRQVPIRSQDELGELAASFNQMSTDLARARDARRQMTADIAHELRTPISIILGHAEALSDGVLPPSPATFHVIHDETKRLNRLVEDLRTLSLSDAGELPLNRRPVSPQELLARVVAAYAPQAQAQQIALRLEAAEDLPLMDVDPDRMAQVLGNLMSNALRYTPAGGQVVLSARANAGNVQLAVHDSGPGIPPQALPHLFDRFYRGDKARQRQDGGSGLGLAIARSIIEGHGGRIWVESTAGQGTTFFLALPQAQEPPPA